MVNSQEALRQYIKADRDRYCPNFKLPWIIRVMIGEEQTRIIHYLKIFRKYEYYINTQGNSIFRRLLTHFYHIRHLRNCVKLNLYLYPNTIGPGIRIVHLGGRIELNAASIGKNFTVTAGVVVGKKDNDDNKATIGDNVELTLGCKVIGKVNIGDNSIICQNSVVIKDIPANSLASGVPISIIKPLKR